ncbi:MAG TPA: DUF1294 domain-containing protein [Caproiciproducens sp.]|nr:DUF1294 domain-containing protein [Caproiciproducens sp.]
MPAYIYCFDYLIIINLFAVLITVSDKRRAQANRWRIPENTLLLISALGGSPAMLLTMRLIHHKTRHKKFMLGIPAMLILQICIIYFMVK